MNRNEGDSLVSDKVDRALSGFFKRQMPATWPAFKYPAATPTVRPVSTWGRRQRWASRLALAACVALVFLGYLALGNIFPGAGSSSGLTQDPSRHIGMGVKPRSGENKTVENGNFEDHERPTIIQKR